MAEAQQQTEVEESACFSCGTVSADRRCRCGVARWAGNFHILGIVSETPHRRLYDAEDATGEHFLLKELQFALFPDRRQIEAFFRESALLLQLHNPDVPEFIDAFEEGVGPSLRLYLAQRMPEGQGLDVLMRQRPIDDEFALVIARHVLETLKVLHAQAPPIFHRNIRPSSLICMKDGRISLIDFGTTREQSLLAGQDEPAVGSVNYMPPEQLAGTVDETTDLYSLGTTLLHLVTGRPPGAFLRGGALDLPPGAALSAPLRQLVSVLVATRDQRCPSAEEALRSLSGLPIRRKAKPLPPKKKTGPPRVRKPLDQKTVYTGVGVGVAVAAFLIIGLAVRFGGHPVAPVAKSASTLTPIVSNKAPQTVEPKSGLTFVALPSGAYKFGCIDADRDCYPWEKPSRLVDVSAFKIGQTEVTVEAYAKCVTAGACDEPKAGEGDEGGPCNWKTERVDHPVNCVNWFQSQQFCRWIGGSLPTAIQWEYAAKSGGQERIYPWGNDPVTGERANGCDKNCANPPERNNATDDGFTYTAPALSFPAGATAQGVYNLAGNVWEWTADWWDEQNKEVRGGSFSSRSRTLRASYRDRWGEPHRRSSWLGFRCVM